MSELYLNYGYSPDKEAIDRSLDLIASNLENVVSESVLRDCFSRRLTVWPALPNLSTR